MKFSFASLFTKLTLATSVAGALVGCDEPNYPTPTPVTESSVGQARVLVVNAAPGAQAATASVDGVAFGMARPYLGMSTYAPVNAGQRLFLYSDPANIPSNAPTTPPPTPRSAAVRSAYLGGTNYTTFITDLPTRAIAGTDQGGIRSVTLTDNLSAPAAGNAKIRFVNLAPTATSGNTNYGIYNSATMSALFSAVPIRAYRGLSSGTGTTATNFANFTEVPAGSYTLDVRSSTTTPPIAGTSQTFMLVAGKIYTFYTRGIAGNATTPLGISVVMHN